MGLASQKNTKVQEIRSNLKKLGEIFFEILIILSSNDQKKIQQFNEILSSSTLLNSIIILRISFQDQFHQLKKIGKRDE